MLRLALRSVRAGRPARLVVLVDYNVVRCAASKGRSSSRALSKILCRLGALCVVGGVYLVYGFAPTRLNPAYDPTRDVDLRAAAPGLSLGSLTSLDLLRLSALPRLTG